MSLVRKAVIPAAGMGTRFLPASVGVPKEMALILAKPAIHWIVEEAVAAGVEEVVLVVSDEKEAMRHYFRPHPELENVLADRGKEDAAAAVRELGVLSEKVRFVRQDEPLGLGHAVWCAAEAVGDSPFLVLLGDALVHGPSPCSQRMVQVAESHAVRNVIGVRQIPESMVSRYGIVSGEQLSDRVYRLDRLVEKPSPEEAPSTLAISGRYLLSPRVFDYLALGRRGAGNEIQLTDAIQEVLKDEPVFAYRYEGRRLDIGNPAGYLDAVLTYAKHDAACRKVLREHGMRI